MPRSAAKKKTQRGKPRTAPAKQRPGKSTEQPVRMARIARGKRPQYFSDPAIDKLLSITMSLIGELSVTRDRLDTVERLLAQENVLRAGDIDAYRPPPAVEAERERRRQAYLARVLRAVEAELTETTEPSMPKSVDEVIEAVSD